MLALLAPLAVYLLYVWVFYGFFLIYCTARRMKQSGKLDTMPRLARAFPWSYLLIGWVLDLVFNYVFGWLMFLETPWGHGLMFTTRCSLRLNDASWRGKLARWICNGWLNPAEENHCHEAGHVG